MPFQTVCKFTESSSVSLHITKISLSKDEMQLWILLRVIKQPPPHSLLLSKMAGQRKGSSWSKISSPDQEGPGENAILFDAKGTHIGEDKLLPSSHFKNYPCETKTSKAAFLQKWQYYNKRNTTKQKVFTISDPIDFDPECLTAQRSHLEQKNCWGKRRAKNHQNWEDSKVIYPFQRLSS